MASELLELVPLLTVAASIGATYGIIRVKTATTAKRLNELEQEAIDMDRRMQGRISSLESEVHKHREDTMDRLARIETKLDILLQAKR